MAPKAATRWSSLLCFGALALVVLLLGGCSDRPLLYGVGVTPERIRPDGSGIADQAKINYSLARRAYVTLSISDPAGAVHVVRDAVLRAPDDYETRFDGSVALGEGPDRRLLPDGTYTIKIKAVDTSGRVVEDTKSLVIEGADAEPLEIANLIVQPTTISPNGDNVGDEASVSYSLSKKAEVTVFVTDPNGAYSLLQPPKEQQGEAGMSTPWDGKENGGRLLGDGMYTLHIQAKDKAGNVAEKTQQVAIQNGGTPRMAIQRVRFWPPIVPLNGTLHVEITVKNIGDTTISTLGPDPGTQYTLNSNYASFRDDKGGPIYYERPGRWRVGIMWNNAPQPYPVRWGFGKDQAGKDKELAPGEELTVQGEIVIDAQLPRTGTFFWAGLEQGGVGFLDTNKGQTEIRFAY